MPGTTPVVGHGRVSTYSIAVERGLTGIDVAAFAGTVERILADPRSWIHTGTVALKRVDSDDADFQIALTSAMTVRRLCGYQIPVETSCWDATHTHVVLNAARWVRGATAYLGDLTAYRTYAVNHEVGHALGHQHAHQCLPDGLAPVMMQQTLGLRAVSGRLCQANPWPYPPGAPEAPGRESPDTPRNNEFRLGNE